MRTRIGYLTDAVGTTRSEGDCSSPMSDAAATGSILEVRRGGVVVSQERNAVVVEQYS